MENIENVVQEAVIERKKPGPKPKSAQPIIEEAVKPEIKAEETVIEEVKEQSQEEKLSAEPTKEPENLHIEEAVEKEDVQEVEPTHHGVLTTNHNYAPGDKVWVAKFDKERDSKGFSKLINSYRFIPTQGEIERIIITDKVRYKLKNVAGSNIDEEDVCWTEKECMTLCAKKNERF